jgi:uncharacterized protein with NRDE domain
VCTLLLFHRAFADTPLLVAANRDEHLERPAAPPSLRTLNNGIKLICPTDLAAGGTWLGANDRGVFSAITNRFGVPKDPARRSRGELVLNALEYATANEAARALEQLDPRRENAFHLAIADQNDGFVVVADGETLVVQTLEPGLTIITERSYAASSPRRERFIREKIGALATAPSNSELEQFLSTHDDEGFEGVCVHVPGLQYGTRSSTVFRSTKTAVSMRFAPGPPCTVSFLDVDLGAIPAQR